MSDLLFALDVGTRKVCGLLVQAHPDGARVAHWAVREHPGRAMLDGQVHVIASASRVIAEVKAELEAASGQRLEQAHVAVAGRSLSMSRAKAAFKTGHSEPLTREDLLAMELQAVREARASLEDPRALGGAYCVGYSLLKATLDGEALLQLEGHRGAEVELEVLATFLPKLALDALQAALHAAGLSAASLTLEPIAAVQLAVPAELRRLNLGFVDIGAGTSDIALTRDGRVDAFAMVPVAGDECTERLCDAFLLDFMQAETLKRSVADAPLVEVTDLFGGQRSIASEDVYRELLPALRYWAKETATALVKLNGGKAPQAVLLAGGGSLCAGVEAFLSDALDIPPVRVGRRPVTMQLRFVDLPQALQHAWAVTPLGIAASALDKRGLPFAHFQVNGSWVQALNLNQSFTAFDALVASGKERVQFFGRPGLATVYSFNGQDRAAKGTLGTTCKLFVNGSVASLDTPLANGDSLTFVDARPGDDGRLTFAQALEREGLGSGACVLNGEERLLPVALSVDGQPVDDLDAAVPDRARLEARASATLGELLQREGVDLGGLIHREIAVTLDGVPKILLQRNYRLQLGGKEASLESPVLPGDEAFFEPGAGFQERVRDLLLSSAPALDVKDAPQEGAWKVRLNGDWAPLDKAERVTMNGRDVDLDEFLIDGADVQVQRGQPCRSVGEALERLGLSGWLAGGKVKLLLNGEAAPLDAPLADGDALDLSLADEALRP